MRKVPLLMLALLVLWLQLGTLGFQVQSFRGIEATTPLMNGDVTGGSAYTASRGGGIVYAFPIAVTGSGVVRSIGVDWADTTPGNVRVALYTAASGKPGSMLDESGTVAITTSTGWQDIPVKPYFIGPGMFWVAVQISVGKTVFYIQSTRNFYYRGFGPFDSSWLGGAQDNVDQWNMRVNYSSPNGQRLEQQDQINTAPPPASLPVTGVGYWSGNGIVHRALNGTGSYAGNLTMDVDYSYKFTITRRETNRLMLEVEYSETRSKTAAGTWLNQNGGNSTQSSVASVKAYYTINLTTMRIEDVSSNLAQSLGYLTYFLIDPQTVHQGGNISGDWYGPVAPFHVGPSRNVIINGGDVEAWSVMYTGDWYGYWHVGNNPSTGTETDAVLYDKTYGLVVGWDLVGGYVYAGGDGSWTETDFDYFRATDSNFMQPHTTAQTGALSFLLQPNLILEVSAAIVVIVIVSLIIQRRKFGRSNARLREVIQSFRKHEIQANKQEVSEEHDET